MKWLTATAILLLAMSIVAAEDKLLLKDGQTVTGKILTVTANDVQIDTGEEKIRVPRWAIEKIDRGGSEVRSASGTRSRRGARGKFNIPHRQRLESTPALDSWIDVLVKKLGSADAGVQTTASAALRAAGPAARDAVERAAASNNEQVARQAKRILSNIDFVVEQQSRDDGSPHDRDRIGNLMTAVKVTDEQAPEFQRIMSGFYAQQDEIAASIRRRHTSVADGGKQIQKLRSEVDTKLATILTETQMTDFRANVPRASNRPGAAKR